MPPLEAGRGLVEKNTTVVLCTRTASSPDGEAPDSDGDASEAFRPPQSRRSATPAEKMDKKKPAFEGGLKSNSFEESWRRQMQYAASQHISPIFVWNT
jgi:hypothetical protein